MSNDTQKADQIAFHFYTKLFYVVNHARATANPTTTPTTTKPDKWFNLETPDSDLFSKEAKDRYRSISSLISSPSTTGFISVPPLEIQVLLTIPELNTNQVLVYISPDSSRTRVEPTPRHVLLEKWVLEFTPRISRSGGSDMGMTGLGTREEEITVPTIYKHGIPLFRSLYSLLRILPAWKVAKRLKRRVGGGTGGGNGMSVVVRIRENGVNDFLDFDSSLHLPTSNHAFPPVPHPLGTLTLTSTYLSNPSFRIDELESLLSSRFLSLEREEELRAGGGGGFVPTLLKNQYQQQQRDSLLSTQAGVPGSPGSLPIRTSLPKSPPRDIRYQPQFLPERQRTFSSRDREDAESIAERFVLPSTSASTSTSAVSAHSGVSGSGAGPAPHPVYGPAPSGAHHRVRTTSTLSNLSNMSVSPPRESSNYVARERDRERPPSISSRPAFPVLNSGSGANTSLSRSPPRATIPLPLPLSMPVTRASSTAPGIPGLSEPGGTLGLIGVGGGGGPGQLARLRKESAAGMKSDSHVSTLASGAGTSSTAFPTLPSSSSSSVSPSSNVSNSGSPRTRPTIINPFKSSTLASASGSSTTTPITMTSTTGSTNFPTLANLGMGPVASGTGSSPAGLSVLRQTAQAQIQTQGQLPSPLSPSPSSFVGMRPSSPSPRSYVGSYQSHHSQHSHQSFHSEGDSRDRRFSSESLAGAGVPGSVGSTSGGAGVAIPKRKRYSSSFSHRYTAQGASAGSGSGSGSVSASGTGAGTGTQTGVGAGTGSVGSDGSSSGVGLGLGTGAGGVPGSLGRGTPGSLVGRKGSLRSLRSTSLSGTGTGAGGVEDSSGRSTHPLSQQTNSTDPVSGAPSDFPSKPGSRLSSRPPHSPSLPPITTSFRSSLPSRPPSQGSVSRPTSRPSSRPPSNPHSASASFLSTKTDDDDISEFVQDIDVSLGRRLGGFGRLVGPGRGERGPLGNGLGHRRGFSEGEASSRDDVLGYALSDDRDAERPIWMRGEALANPNARRTTGGVPMNRDRDRTITQLSNTSTAVDRGVTMTSPTSTIETTGLTTASPTRMSASPVGVSPGSGDVAGTGPGMSPSGPGQGLALASSPPPGTVPMLTSESEVDEKLRRMNEAFLASLEGLGSGSSRVRRTRGGTGESTSADASGGNGNEEVQSEGDSPQSTRSRRSINTISSTSSGSTTVGPSGASTIRMGMGTSTASALTTSPSGAGTSGSRRVTGPGAQSRPRIPSLLSGGVENFEAPNRDTGRERERDYTYPTFTPHGYTHRDTLGSGRGSPVTPQTPQSQTQSQLGSGMGSSSTGSGPGSQEVIGKLELGGPSSGKEAI